MIHFCVYLPLSQVFIQLSKSSFGPASGIVVSPDWLLHWGIGSQYLYSSGLGGVPVPVVWHVTSLVTLTLYSKHNPAIDATGGPYSTVSTSVHVLLQV